MATVKQGTLTGVPEVADWDKHLRPILKRRVHKRERRAQAAAIQNQLDEAMAIIRDSLPPPSERFCPVCHRPMEC